MSQMHGASLVDTLPELWNMQIKGRGMMQRPSFLHVGSCNYVLGLNRVRFLDVLASLAEIIVTN